MEDKHDEIKDKHDEIKDKHDEVKYTHDEEVEYEHYKKLLLARRTDLTKNPRKMKDTHCKKPLLSKKTDLTKNLNRMKDNHDEIKDKHDEETEDEYYRKLLLSRRTHLTKNPYRSFKTILNKFRSNLMVSSIDNDYAFQLLQEHIRKTEHDVEGILSSLEFVSFQNGTLTVRILSNSMRKVLLAYNKPQQWSLALRKHGLKTIKLVL